MPRLSAKADKRLAIYRRIDGLPVKNLMKKIRLTITNQDCTRATKKAPNSCAAALAAVRGVPNCLEARIHIGRIFLRVKEGAKEYWLRGKTTGALRTEIATFDRGGSFEPGVYDINPLSFSEQPHGKRKGTVDRPSHHRPDGKRRTPKVLDNVRTSGKLEYGRNRA